ncbi:MAG: VWA domain-containing protein [Halieaceae bacterium]|nr:VWA domain-containing protein [Halieaceae bacterium]
MLRRRPMEQFSLSFLDVICCGFGAVILLLMITKTVEPQLIEASTLSLEGRISSLREQLYELRGETRVVNRDLTTKQEQLSRHRERIAILRRELAELSLLQEALDQELSGNDQSSRQLAIARQRLSEEMQRLLRTESERRNQLIGGIPVDSEYIIFVIDTSGSMKSYSWGRMIKELEATLSIYPKVKGIQVLNDMGRYMFSRYRGKWMPDTPGRRKVILDTLRSWEVFSNSSPVEGITEAISSFYAPDKKISIYVFGDEFTGQSIQQVVDTVDRLNRVDRHGNRRVRIHAVGFPVLLDQPDHLQNTGIRFATLMRELTYRNGGSFVALEDYN